MLADYAGFSPNVVKVSQLLAQDPGLNCWGIHDLGDRPLPTYARGRICIIGDAAHASSPHFGAGAGFGIEDSAVMAELLADAAQLVNSSKATTTAVLETAFQVFDECRRERTQWLVKHSRDAIAIYQWHYPPSGRDPGKCKKELEWRTKVIWDASVTEMANSAKQELRKRFECTSL